MVKIEKLPFQTTFYFLSFFSSPHLSYFFFSFSSLSLPLSSTFFFLLLPRKIDQTRPLLKTYSQKGVVLKLFSGRVCFWRGLANEVGELDTWRHLVDSPVELASCCLRGRSRHSYWRNAFLRKKIFNFKRV